MKPFPEGFARNVDFLPSLDLQARLVGRQELRDFEAITSASRSRTRPEDSSDILSFSRTTTRKQGLRIRLSPSVDKVTHQEILAEIQARDFEDATIKRRVIEHDIPRELETLPAFQGYDYLFEHQSASTRRARLMRRLLGLKLWNPYHTMLGELLNIEIVKSRTDSRLRRLQSCLVTDVIVPSDPDIGWEPLTPHHDRMLVTLSADTPRQRRFWLDTGKPRPFEFRYNGIMGQIRIFELLKNEEIIALITA